MTAIWTVLGPIEPAVLGRTLMHEHVLCDFYRVTGLLNQLLNDEALASRSSTLLDGPEARRWSNAPRSTSAAMSKRYGASRGRAGSTSSPAPAGIGSCSTHRRSTVSPSPIWRI